MHEYKTVVSDYVTTVTSVIAPSTLTSYKVTTAPGK